MLTVALLLVLALSFCGLVVRKTFLVLRLDLMDTLVWLGLAEFELPRARRRRRPGA